MKRADGGLANELKNYALSSAAVGAKSTAKVTETLRPASVEPTASISTVTTWPAVNAFAAAAPPTAEKAPTAIAGRLAWVV